MTSPVIRTLATLTTDGTLPPTQIPAGSNSPAVPRRGGPIGFRWIAEFLDVDGEVVPGGSATIQWHAIEPYDIELAKVLLAGPYAFDPQPAIRTAPLGAAVVATGSAEYNSAIASGYPWPRVTAIDEPNDAVSMRIKLWITGPAASLADAEGELAAQALAAASAAQVTADAAVVEDAWPSTSGYFTVLTARPHMTRAGTATLVKDNWRCERLFLKAPRTIAGLAITTTVAATGGTAALMFGIWSSTAGRPAARFADWATLGTIDLTQTPVGTFELLTPGLIIPAGEHFIGCAWTGDASGSPTLVTHDGIAPYTASGSGGNNGYLYAASGGSVPNPFVPAANTTAGIVIYAKIP